jgi:hypothetical protein
VLQGLVRLKIAMRPNPSRMHDAFGDAFVIEMSNLLSQNKIFEKSWAALAGFQGILIVGNR